MGFFKNLGRAINPVRGITDPKGYAKDMTKATLDPAGQGVRFGTNQPFTLRSGVDPTGKVIMKPQAPVVAPNSYQSPPPLQLSVGAQQLLADMRARMAARQSGATYQAGTRASAPPAPAMSGAPAPVTQPQMAIGMVRQPGISGFADGGKVGGRRAKKAPLTGCEHYENKAYTRKPNGKKC